MKSFVQTLTILACIPLIFIGCEGRQTAVTPVANNDRQGETPTAAMTAPTAARLLQAPTEIGVFELPPEALPVWRNFRREKPALILLSDDPFLLPIPDPQRAEVERLIEAGDNDDFKSRAKQQIANPTLLPSQTLRAAMEAGFLSRILWILPVSAAQNELSLEAFRRQVVSSGIMDHAQADEMTLDKGVFSGWLGEIPFQAAPLQALPDVDKPALLHIDLSYFGALHQNEIKTPLYGLMHQTLSLLRQAGWPVMAATLSISTEEGQVPLEIRFLADTIEQIFNNPDMLADSMPESWDLRRQALYLETFFQPEKTLALYQKMEAVAPDDASVKFDLYRTLKMFRDRERSLAYLDQATSLDPGYGREYIHLGLEAIKNKRADLSTEFFRKATSAFPANPFIRIQLAELLFSTGKTEEAAITLHEIEQISWSSIYYPEMSDKVKILAMEHTSSGMKQSESGENAGDEAISPK